MKWQGVPWDQEVPLALPACHLGCHPDQEANPMDLFCVCVSPPSQFRISLNFSLGWGMPLGGKQGKEGGVEEGVSLPAVAWRRHSLNLIRYFVATPPPTMKSNSIR